MKNILISLGALLCLASCGKKPAPEQVTVPKAVEPASAQVGVAPGSAAGQVLNAPGNYVRGVVGNIDKAKQAVALSNRQAEQRMNQDPSAETAGN